ncbi:amino acid transporter [Mycena vulgaris]|nr:amino acid transporter [Mycena vulgaris]
MSQSPTKANPAPAAFIDETNSFDDKTLLARLGYKQKFKREFSVVELFGFGFSINAVVPSVAATLVYSLPYGGPTAMIWGWLASSVFIMYIALALAELGSAAPTSGGVYYWTYKFSSPKYRNLLCWMVGYTSTITYESIAGVAGLNWSCATVIMAGAAIGTDGVFVPTLHQTYGVFIAVLVVQNLMASCATRVIARLQNTLIVLNVALVLAIVITLPAATPAEFKNTAKYTFSAIENFSTWSNGYAFILSFLAPLLAKRICAGGFNAGQKNASVAVPWAIVYGIAGGCILGFAVQIALAFCMGTDIPTILSNPVQQLIATIILNSLGKRGMLAMWSFLFIALFFAATSLLMSASRQTFAFSRDGALVFSKFLYKINSFTGTPVHCVWFSSACAALLTLLTFTGPAETGAIFSLGVIGQYVAISIPIAAQYLGGQVEFSKGPFHLGAFSKFVAIIAVLWMWFMTIVLLFPTEPNPVAETMNYTIVVLGGIFAIALGYYYFPVYGGVHWFNGPISNIDEEIDKHRSTSTEKLEDSPI